VAIYRVVIPKRIVSGGLIGTSWRNVYDVEATDYDSALAAADVIAGREMLFHADIVVVREVTAHLITEPARRVGKQLVVNRAGVLSPTGSLLPLWNCVRVDYLDTGVGRPERKYYRPPLHTSQVTGLVLETTFFDIVQAAVIDIVSLTNYVGPSGEGHAAAGAAVNSLVQMRQTGWHRRRRPGFVRGYVPV
jgi:hypothetical protein